MRAVVVDRLMSPDELCVRETPPPEITDEGVRISVRAAGCNFSDILMLEGKYQVKPPLPFVTGGEVAAYDAPFPDETFKEGARIFPSLVPTSTDDPAVPDNLAAWKVFKQWDKPLVCCFSDDDPVTTGGDKPFLKLVPGAQGQPHVMVKNAHHFFQEDGAPQLAQIVLDAIARG